MALGDNRYDLSGSLYQAFDNQSVQVQLTPSTAGQNVPRDKFLKPLQPPPSVTISIVVSKAEDDIKANESGGKPVEVLQFYAKPGTIKENDEISWNGHTFRTTTVWPFGLGGLQQLLSCKAEREVDR